MKASVLAAAFALIGCSKTTSEPAPKALEAKETDRKAEEQAAVATLIGVTPPEWNVERWLNTQPLELAKLKGDVVLVRWWTADCPYCAGSAPALNSFHAKYASKGLHVIGVYHHKDAGEFKPSVYEDTAKSYGFTFPLAFDPDWRTLHSWLRDKNGNKVDTGWTSVTFLIDRKGVIRHVHPGGSYKEGDPAYADLQAAIERLLAEPA